MDKLFILLISALDFRRITREGTPYLYNLFENYPWTHIKTIPETDLVPTLLTGRYPHEHGMWQVKLKRYQNDTLEELMGRTPDILSTTAQCFVHLITGSYNLASIPRWRRKRFEIYKTRYMKRSLEQYLSFNGKDSFLNVVGENKSGYLYSNKLDELSSTLPVLSNPNYPVELFETHSLDTLQHWYLDDPSKMGRFYKLIDGFIKVLHDHCTRKGFNLMILSDHGQEPVFCSIDVKQILAGLEIPRNEFTYYIEAPKIRLWFHSDRAREKIVNTLSSLGNGRLLSYKDMYEFNIEFQEDSYGEFYFIADPGYIFFPNDFYHPLGNIYLGLRDWQQRPRLVNPKYRGYHGYLPHHDSEKGFMLLLDDRYVPTKEPVEIIDVAPTVLGLLGYDKPNYMRGNCVFHS